MWNNIDPQLESSTGFGPLDPQLDFAFSMF